MVTLRITEIIIVFKTTNKRVFLYLIQSHFVFKIILYWKLIKWCVPFSVYILSLLIKMNFPFNKQIHK